MFLRLIGSFRSRKKLCHYRYYVCGIVWIQPEQCLRPSSYDQAFLTKILYDQRASGLTERIQHYIQLLCRRHWEMHLYIAEDLGSIRHVQCTSSYNKGPSLNPRLSLMDDACSIEITHLKLACPSIFSCGVVLTSNLLDTKFSI